MRSFRVIIFLDEFPDQEVEVTFVEWNHVVEKLAV